MRGRKKPIASGASFLADPATWREQHKDAIILCVIVVILPRVLIIMGSINLRTWLVRPAVWAQRLAFPFPFSE